LVTTTTTTTTMIFAINQIFKLISKMNILEKVTEQTHRVKLEKNQLHHDHIFFCGLWEKQFNFEFEKQTNT